MRKELPSSSETKEFEFGCIKPTSPSSEPKTAVSPADEFFINGRLLPHSFPIQSKSLPRKSSSSISTTSSCRSSSSDVAERKAFQKKLVDKERSVLYQGINGNKSYNNGSTFLRWQIISIISPAPVLGPSVSRRRRSSGEFGLKLSPRKKIKESDEHKGICLRILRSFVKSCRACHAMEDNDLVLK